MTKLPPPNKYFREFYAHEDGRMLLPTPWKKSEEMVATAWLPISVIPFAEDEDFVSVVTRFFDNEFQMQSHRPGSYSEMSQWLAKISGCKSHKALVNKTASLVTENDSEQVFLHFAPPSPGAQWDEPVRSIIGSLDDPPVVIARNVCARLKAFYQGLQGVNS